MKTKDGFIYTPELDRILCHWKSEDGKYIIVVNTITPDDFDQSMHKYTCSIRTLKGSYQFDGKVHPDLLEDDPLSFIEATIEAANRKISEL